MERRQFIARGLGAPALVGTACWAPLAFCKWSQAVLLEAAPAQAAQRAPGVARGVGASDDRFEAMAKLVSERMAELKVPGAALGIFKDGQTQLRAFGIESVEAPDQPVTVDTLFPLASLSKTVTATAMMRLVEQGKVKLDAPVQTYLPTFRVQDPVASRQVTVQHLLSHLPGWEGQLTPDDYGIFSLQFFADSMKDLPQLAPPGAVWSYNNAGFALAGRVIEVVTGGDIHTALREQVFAPLELTRAFTRIGDVVTYPFAQGHTNRADGSVGVVRPFLLGSSVTAGGVAMSISDLMSYARFHLGETGTARAGALSRATLDAMKRPVARKNATDDEIATSWHLRRVGGVETYMHGGTAGANHRLLVELVPERGLAFAILTNHADGWRLVETVERSILKLYENVALTPNQAICHRGINEDMRSHATPLVTQPPLGQYEGTYARPPMGSLEVHVQGDALLLGAPTSANRSRLVFYGSDVAYVEAGAAAGTPYEFIRAPAGQVGWIRNNGRIAKNESV